MIKSDRDAARLYAGENVRKFQAFERVAYRKLDMLNAAHRLEALQATGKDNTASALMISGVSALSGTTAQRMSRS